MRSGGSATFIGPDGLRNVVARVTGGERSSIDGTLGSTIGTADLWLINPSGIIMGSNARLDVPGSLHLSTADEIHFSDGAVLSAGGGPTGMLTTADPMAFGFLSDRPSEISLNSAILEVPLGRSLNLIAGDLAIDRSVISAPDGSIQLVAMGGPGSVVRDVDATTIERGGSIDIRNGSRVSASGDGSGRIFILGERFFLDSGSRVTINADGAEGITPGEIRIQAKDTEIIGSSIDADTFGVGTGAAIRFQGERLHLERGGSVISTGSFGGTAGSIDVAVESLSLDGGGEARSTGLSSAVIFGDGNAGGISVEAGSIEILAGAQIESDTLGDGDSGSVTLVARRSVEIDGRRAAGITGVTTDADSGTGDAGVVTIRTPRLLLSDGGEIRSTTRGAGSAGSIHIEADTVTLDGSGGERTGITTGTLIDSTGDAGKVEIDARQVVVRGGAEIRSESDGAGRAGDIEVEAERLQVRSARVTTEGLGAEGGRIRIMGAELILLDSGEVISSGITAGAGDASVIRLEARTIALGGGSRVESLLADGVTPAGVTAGVAELVARRTVVTPGSTVEASGMVEISGLEDEVGNGLDLERPVIADTDALLADRCALGVGDNEPSTFRRVGRGRLPDSPLTALGGSGSLETAIFSRDTDCPELSE